MEDTPRDQESSSSHVKQRWLAAAAYLGPGFLLGLLSKHRSEHLNWHIRQGFTLFFVEAVGIALIIILDHTIGRIPLLGFLVMLLLQLVAFVVFLVLSILGFVKALAGEHFQIPVLDEYALRVPLHEEEPR
ncbi:MAG: DUF4870 domain-containing protein [Gemmatimonadetes bacterium]|nr:DUF4870 domain-containing protein [Gemmatimonadota bacterium]